MKLKTLPIFLAFFVMGFGDVVGTLVGFATKEFDLSSSLAGLLPFAGLIPFGLFSVPIGILSDRKGKKYVLITFLLIALIGLLIPSISIAQYYYVLIAIFMVGIGMCGLQVAGNPAMRDVSEEGKYSRNLTFAQFIKSIGTNTGPYVVPLIVFLGLAWQNIFLIYAIVVAITLFAILPLKMVNSSEAKGLNSLASVGSSFALLKIRRVSLMVLGIFLYVGAEVGLNSWIATYLENRFGLDIERLATLGIGFFLTSLVIGRLLGSIILNYLSPKRFFIISSLVGLAGLLGMFMPSETIVIVSIFIAGIGFGNIFPLIFSILIDSMPERDNELSGLLVMAIVGGAFIPAIMGVVAEWSIQISFLIPLGIFLYLSFLAIYNMRFTK
ncbi:MAG: MFS transporter [Bacteroidales bacterium]|nr:MFS transporter [Bacteroidales bacterium]